jgi:very-short-patch-repair endonuclease
LNAPITGRYGEGLGTPDLLWRAERVVLEYEGDQHRTDKAQSRADVERYEAFRDAGRRLIRVTAADLAGARRQALIRRTRALLAS